MRTRTTVLPFVALLGGFLFSACSSPQWPNCETDDQCKDRNGETVDYYCINQQCQECRDDSNCDAGETCVSGRCEAAGQCQTDSDCQGGMVCRLDQCVEVQCTSDDDCAQGQRCEGDQCVDAECTSDYECGAGMECSDGQCIAATQRISAGCQPVSPGAGEVVQLGEVFFNFDQSDLTVDARSTLETNAECIKQAPDITVVVEGHCDERGTQEYNLALGERRANAVLRYLRNLGIDTSNMRTVSKGENEPTCNQRTESCFSKNRRVKFIQRRASTM